MEALTLQELQIKLMYAQNFTPHKVEYYKERIRLKLAEQNIFSICNPNTVK